MFRKRISYKFFYFILAIIFFINIGCVEKNKISEDNNLIGITKNSQAEWVITNLATGVIQRNILNNLDNGIFDKKELKGLSGISIITGKQSYITESTSNSSSHTYEANITVVFNNFKTMAADNVEAFVNGTIVYYEYRYSKQTGLNYSSSSSMSMKSQSTVKVMFVFTDEQPGYEDTITFDASGKDEYVLSGTCRASDGNTYNF